MEEVGSSWVMSRLGRSQKLEAVLLQSMCSDISFGLEE
jgi:hypothetical protein